WWLHTAAYIRSRCWHVPFGRVITVMRMYLRPHEGYPREPSGRDCSTPRRRTTMKHQSLGWRKLAVIAATALAVTLAGCGSSDDDNADLSDRTVRSRSSRVSTASTVTLRSKRASSRKKAWTSNWSRQAPRPA